MKTMNTLEHLVLSKLAELFNAKLGEFTFYTSLPCLPDHANDFAQFLDTIPSGNTFFNPTRTKNHFSQIYGKILTAQKTSPLAVTLGRNKFNDTKNWLSPFTIPKNIPTLEAAHTIIKDANKAEVKVVNNQQAISIPKVPEFPNIIYSAPLLDFFQKVARSKFTVTVTFNQAASIPVSFGDWFFSGAFLYAYQTPDNWNSSIISWDDVFGEDDGLLKYINNAIVLVSNMTIALVISGNFNADTLKMLQAIPDQVIFPFYQQIAGAQLDFALQKDNSIKITFMVPEKSNYVFGVQYQSINHYLS